MAGASDRRARMCGVYRYLGVDGDVYEDKCLGQAVQTQVGISTGGVGYGCRQAWRSGCRLL